MPIWLKLHGETLTCKLGGYDTKAEFQDELARLKEHGPYPRRYNPDTKKWEFPATPENALKLMTSLEPVASVEVQNMVTEAQLEVSEGLITSIGDDGEVFHPVLRNVLFPYQRAFVAWSREHPHSIVADEMGVGKTLEAIAAVAEGHGSRGPGRAGPSLIVCPKVLMKRWRREILHGPTDADGKAIYADWPRWDVQLLDGANANKRRAQLKAPADFYVVNWEKLRSDATMIADAHEWFAIIADEAHRAKNRKAQQTKGLLKLHAPIQLALTGTPIMNSPDELWPLMAWIRPEQYGPHVKGGGFWEWHYRYVDDFPTKFGRIMKGVRNMDDLRFELADKMVRRTKVEVLPDLPAKLPPEVIEVDLNPSERKLYEEAERALILDAANFAERQAREELGDTIPETDLLPSQEDVLRKRIEEKAAELAAMPLERLSGVIENGAARVTALRQITARAKARAAVEIIRDNPDTPFVTFTWFVEPAQWIAEQLRSDHHKVGVIAGSGGDPTAEERAFQSGETDQIVCTIAKGGTGLDLYRSSHALMADEDWVPDINKQAVDRLHRQGQTNDVSTTIFRVPDSVDTGRVADALAFKGAILREFYGS